MTTQELIEPIYNKVFAERNVWDALFADNFNFIGNTISKANTITGKASYLEVIKRFSQMRTFIIIKEMIIDGDSSSVIYGKLSSLTIFFDPLTFNVNPK